MTYQCIESFCGAGGLSLGLHQAGFNVRLAFDIDEASINTYKQNLAGLTKCNCFVADIYGLTGQELLSMIQVRKGELSLFSGGPPCQGFSKQKRGAHLGDARNELIYEYVRLIHEISPKFFLLENVSSFGQKRGAKFVEHINSCLDNYILFPNFYNCADYGLAQTRERFIIVGKRKDIKASFTIPSPTSHKWKTIKDAIGDLPEPPLDFTNHPEFPNHQRARVSEKNIERFSYVPQGGGWLDIPYRLRLDCHKKVDSKKGGWPDVYGRLKWDGQAPTITRGFDSFTRGRYGHPEEDRPLTPREAARLQGFPDWFVFSGNRGEVRSQIGNAVPPPLGEVIGKEIIKTLNENLLSQLTLPSEDFHEEIGVK